MQLLGRDPDEMFQERLDGAIRQWLVDYREALIRACKEDRADLARKLCISLSGSGCQTTTRMTQLIVSLQTLILNIRTGEFTRFLRLSWSSARKAASGCNRWVPGDPGPGMDMCSLGLFMNLIPAANDSSITSMTLCWC